MPFRGDADALRRELDAGRLCWLRSRNVRPRAALPTQPEVPTSAQDGSEVAASRANEHAPGHKVVYLPSEGGPIVSRDDVSEGAELVARVKEHRRFCRSAPRRLDGGRRGHARPGRPARVGDLLLPRLLSRVRCARGRAPPQPPPLLVATRSPSIPRAGGRGTPRPSTSPERHPSSTAPTCTRPSRARPYRVAPAAQDLRAPSSSGLDARLPPEQRHDRRRRPRPVTSDPSTRVGLTGKVAVESTTPRNGGGSARHASLVWS